MNIRVCVFFLLTVLAFPTFAAEGGLKAGAARVDITPLIEELVQPFSTIHDKTYARVLMLDNGSARAAIVMLDVAAIEAGVFADLSRRISQQSGVPLTNILLSASHTHNNFRLDKDGIGIILPGSTKYTARVMAATLQAVKQATDAMQPARAGYAAGKAYLNAARTVWSVAEQRHIVGRDRTGTEPVDRTLGVLKVENTSGEPIALVLNYGIEPVMNQFAKSEIGGDVVGAAARYIEQRLGDKAVAIFTLGTMANPAYRVEPNERDPQASYKLTDAMATLLGEEALAAASEIQNPASNVQIGGAMKTLQCQGKMTTPFNLPRECSFKPHPTLPACVFKDKDTDPVSLNMWLLKIGDVALVQSDSNIMPAVGDKLKQASPLANTLIVSLNFGPMRYVIDDASYVLNTYEATASRAKQGCAEQGFIRGALEMLEQLR